MQSFAFSAKVTRGRAILTQIFSFFLRIGIIGVAVSTVLIILVI